jgi:hypothetical protein
VNTLEFRTWKVCIGSGPTPPPESGRYVTADQKRIQPSEPAVRRGARVEATEGGVGQKVAMPLAPSAERQVVHLQAVYDSDAWRSVSKRPNGEASCAVDRDTRGNSRPLAPGYTVIFTR